MIEQTASALNLSSDIAVQTPPPAGSRSPQAANENSTVPDAARLAAEALAREQIRAEQARRKAAERRRWLLLAACVLAVLAGLRLFPAQVVRILPGMAHVYEALGMTVQSRPLKLADMRLIWTRGPDNKQELRATGRIVNTATHALPMPRITLHLVDDTGRSLYRWRIPVRHARLLPAGSSARFRTRLAQVPARAVAVRVQLTPASP